MKLRLIHTFALLACLGLPVTATGDALPPTATQQAALTPRAVLDDLLVGNVRYVEGKVTILENTIATSK